MEYSTILDNLSNDTKAVLKQAVSHKCNISKLYVTTFDGFFIKPSSDIPNVNPARVIAQLEEYGLITEFKHKTRGAYFADITETGYKVAELI